MWKLYKTTKNLYHKHFYTNLCTECKRAMKDNNIYKVNQICKSSDTKAFYNFINYKLGREKPSIIIRDVNTNENETDKDATELYANF